MCGKCFLCLCDVTCQNNHTANVRKRTTTKPNSFSCIVHQLSLEWLVILMIFNNHSREHTGACRSLEVTGDLEPYSWINQGSEFLQGEIQSQSIRPHKRGFLAPVKPLVLFPRRAAHLSLQALISQTGISLFIYFIYCDSTTRYAIFSFTDRINNLRV